MKTLEFLIGRAGTRKTSTLISKAAQRIKNGEKVLIIVPEPFTFECERMLAEQMGAGITDMVVYSFTSLAARILEETGSTTVHLSKQGKRMVIRKCIEEHAGELRAFSNVAKKSGFAEKCDELFSRLKRFLITPGMLCEAADGGAMPEFFAQKLRDMALIYGAAEEYLASRYMDTEDKINALIESLGRSSARGAHVYVDGFEYLTEQRFRVIGALMDICETMTVTECMSLNAKGRDRELFEPQEAAFSRLCAMGAERGMETRVRQLKRDGSEGYAAEFTHMEHELFAYPYEQYDGVVGGITLLEATSTKKEVEAVCNAIRRAVFEGARYRDIAVIVSDMDEYAALLADALKRYEIPFFMDASRPFINHPLAELVLASLRCVTRGFAAEDVITVSKCAFLGIEPENADKFENHIIKYGLRGKRLFEPFAQEDATDEINKVRRFVIEPLLELRTGMSEERTASGKTEKLYEYLTKLDVCEHLAELTHSLRAENELALAEETEQAWTSLMELLGQMHAIMGDVNMANLRYCAIIEEGIAAYDIGVIPTTADQVLIGDTVRTCASASKRVFIVGCCEGKFPVRIAEDAMISDRELALMRENGIMTWESSTERSKSGQFAVYNAMCKAKEQLFLSYTPGGGDRGLPRSSVLDKLTEIFPDIVTVSSAEGLQPYHKEAGFNALIGAMRSLIDNSCETADGKALYSWFRKDERSSGLLERAEKAMHFKASPPPFGKELARLAYGTRMTGSATRLETFNSCAFKHFMRFAVSAYPRREFKERKADVGTFYHDALDALIKRIIDSGVSFNDVDNRDVEYLLENEIFPPLIEGHNNGVLTSSARMRAQCELMKKRVTATGIAIVRQIAAGKFRPESTEVSFGDGGTFPPLVLTASDGTQFKIVGKIDRLDTYDDGTKHIRIVDYKTGGLEFNYSELFNGLKLQLPLYVAAVLAADEAASAAGMYYMPVKLPSLSERGTKPMTREDIERELFRQFKLKGITVNDLKVVEATEHFSRSSDIIEASRKDDGVSGRGIVSQGLMRLTVDYAKKKAESTLDEIMSGRADVSRTEYGFGMSNCDMCDYASVCMFDSRFEDCAVRRLKPMTADEFESAAAEIDAIGRAEDGGQGDGKS